MSSKLHFGADCESMLGCWGCKHVLKCVSLGNKIVKVSCYGSRGTRVQKVLRPIDQLDVSIQVIILHWVCFMTYQLRFNALIM